MRRALVALVLLAAACASTPSQHAMGISVNEVRQPGSRPSALGTHFYRITVQNHSSTPFVVQTIHVAPGGMSEMDVDNATQEFGDTVMPDETRTFDMMVTVLASRGNNVGFIDALQITLDCRTDSGEHFIESGNYTIGIDSRY